MSATEAVAQGQGVYDSPPGYLRNDPPQSGGGLPIPEELQGLIESQKNGRNSFCAIVVTQNGILAAGIGNQELSSTLAGGRPGVADVTTSTGAFTFSIDPAVGFTNAPANGSANTTFSSTYSATGATNYAVTPGNITMKLKKGTTTVETNLIATRTPDAFPAGDYAAELTVRCE